MSKKQLPVADIANELEGASSFFTPPSPAVLTVPTLPAQSKAHQPLPSPSASAVPPVEQQSTPSGKHERAHARMHANIPPNQHKNSLHPPPGEPAPDWVETIRKSVKRVGREEFYIRMTAEEKSQVAKVVFTFNELDTGEGKKVSANDIGRIALHFLLADYQENGQQSMLVRVLEALNA